jgi:methyl-accepting chemotaxis protein
MRIKFKLSIWLITITAVVVTGITILLLRQASGISYYLNIRSLGHLTSQCVEFWKGQEDGYIRTLHTLAKIMGDYESIQASERRDRYDDMLRSALEAEPQMAAMYTVWKPNAIDNMDSLNIGRKGSSSTGLYAMAYLKEAGKITGHTSGDIDNVIAHITGPNAYKDRIDNPAFT